MQNDAEPAEKCTVVEQLSFDAKTAKRMAWSEWEFTVVGPFEIEVCNASYGYLKDGHTYRLMVDQHGFPASCDCLGFQYYYSSQNKCGKHMLAVAAIGGPTLLDAAATFRPHSMTSDMTETENMAEKLKPDGGEPNSCPNGNPHCEGPESDNLPCFSCFEGEGPGCTSDNYTC